MAELSRHPDTDADALRAQAARLATLHAACFATHPPPWSAASFTALLRDPLAFVMADSRALLAGRAVAGEAELLTLAVLPAHRRSGLARALLADFAHEARHRKAATAFREVAEDNLAARALYAADGWAETGRRPRYYGAVAALILQKPLGPPA